MSFKSLFLPTAFLLSSAFSAATTIPNLPEDSNTYSIPPSNASSITFPSLSPNTNTDTISACMKIAALDGFETQSLPQAALNSDYDYAKDHYWSAANADLIPQCVVFPTCAEDVSNIISIINDYDDVKFAVKSGGHNPNVGWSCTDGGILIAMSSMANTTVSDDRNLAHVGPGSRWSGVMGALEPYDLATVGGRLGDVGVGGYMLGGGLSFLSAEHGLACDTIMNYEVVLANSSIINANKDENPDLFWALKGGGNQFGIVTRYDMRTFQMDQVWGGTRVYSGDKATALINATQEFTQNFHDNKAAIIVTGNIVIDGLLEIFVVFLFYDGPQVPKGVFDMFDAIQELEDNTKVQSYTDLLNSNDQYNIYGMRYLIRGTTLPVLPSPQGNDLFNYHYQTWKQYVMTEGQNHTDFVFSLAYQPLPTAISKASLAAGGNTLSIDPDSGAHMWMEYDVSWKTSQGDDAAHAFAMNITESIDQYAKTKYRGVKSVGYVEQESTSGNKAEFVDGTRILEEEQYSPIFLNDAMYDQKPLQSYRNGSYGKLKGINERYDPEGFWRTRTGGFKFD